MENFTRNPPDPFAPEGTGSARGKARPGARSRPGRSWGPLAALGSVLLVAGCGSSGESAPPGQARRVILISCDTLRADHLGLYGYARDTSPNLDALAAESVVFEEAYATAPMTVPAMSSVLTGRYPIEIGTTFDNHLLIPPEIDTLAEVLARHDVASGAVVSNFVLRRPATTEEDCGVSQGFGFYDDVMPGREINRSQFERVAEDTTDAAIAYLAEHVDDAPFFFWVHYQDPHGPYTPPRKYEGLFAGEGEGQAQVETTGTRWGRGGIPAYQMLDDRNDPAFYRNRYDAEIRYFDDELGRLLDWLRDNGFYEDTLLVFTADHGESLGDHNHWFSHAEHTYRDVVRVPLLVRYLDGMARPATHQADALPGERCDRVASHLDVWSTTLNAFGIEPPPSRGQSLLGDLPDTRLVGQFLYPENDQPMWWSVGDGRHRVLWMQDMRYDGPKKRWIRRLFDIRNDPAETQDLSETDPAKVDELSASFNQMLSDIPQPPPQGVRLDVSSETEAAAMEALGYAGHGH